MFGKPEVSDTLLGLQELSYSIPKFITYCRHIAEELESGMNFSQEGYRGGGYAAILQDSLKITHGSKTEPIGLESNIELLIHLLDKGFLDDSHQYYGYTYSVLKRLIQFSEENYSTHIKTLAEKGYLLYNSAPKKLAPPKHFKIGENILHKIDVSLQSFSTYIKFLKFISQQPEDLYVGNEGDIHPKYNNLINGFQSLLSAYENWEIQRAQESEKTQTNMGNRFSQSEISDWYKNLRHLPLEQQVLHFGVNLLKIGEFDTLKEKEDIYTSLLSLAGKVGNEYTQDIEAYIDTQESSNTYDEFDTTLSMYLWEFMGEIYDGSADEQNECITMIFEFLEEEGINISEEIYEIKEFKEKTYHLFSFLLIGNYITEEDLKEQLLKMCLEYFQETDPQYEIELLEFFSVDNKNYSFSSLSKNVQGEVQVMEKQKFKRSSAYNISREMDPKTTEIAGYFDSFYAFLQILDTKPTDLYVSFQGELSLHPKYEVYNQAVEKLLDATLQLQAKDFEERYRLGTLDDYDQIIKDHESFYTGVSQENDIMKKSCLLGTYILGLGGFEDFAQNDEVRDILLRLSRRFANDMTEIISNHIFQDENNAFQGELNGYLVNILDILHENEVNIGVLISHINVLIDFLEQTGIVIPEEIGLETDIIELTYQILVNLLLLGIIGDRSYGRQIGYLCLSYFKNKETDTEIKILNYLRDNQ